MKRYFRFSIRSILTFLFIFSICLCVGIFFWPDPNNTLPISRILQGEVAAKVQSRSAKAELIFLSKDKDKIRLALVNNSPSKIVYTGFTPDSYSERPDPGHINPICLIEQKQNGIWTKKNVAVCGTGLADLAVASGHAGKFEVFGIDVNLPARIGVQYSGADASNRPVSGILWSEVNPASK